MSRPRKGGGARSSAPLSVSSGATGLSLRGRPPFVPPSPPLDQRGRWQRYETYWGAGSGIVGSTDPADHRAGGTKVGPTPSGTGGTFPAMAWTAMPPGFRWAVLRQAPVSFGWIRERDNARTTRRLRLGRPVQLDPQRPYELLACGHPSPANAPLVYGPGNPLNGSMGVFARYGDASPGIMGVMYQDHGLPTDVGGTGTAGGNSPTYMGLEQRFVIDLSDDDPGDGGQMMLSFRATVNADANSTPVLFHTIGGLDVVVYDVTNIGGFAQSVTVQGVDPWTGATADAADIIAAPGNSIALAGLAVGARGTMAWAIPEAEAPAAVNLGFVPELGVIMVASSLGQADVIVNVRGRVLGGKSA